MHNPDRSRATAALALLALLVVGDGCARRAAKGAARAPANAPPFTLVVRNHGFFLPAEALPDLPVVAGHEIPNNSNIAGPSGLKRRPRPA